MLFSKDVIEEQKISNWKRFKNLLFDWGTFIGVVYSVYEIVYNLRALDKDYRPIIVALLIMLGSILMLLVTTIRHADEARRDYNQALTKIDSLKTLNANNMRNAEIISKLIHNICHEYRAVATELFVARMKGKEAVDALIKKNVTSMFYNNAIVNVKEIFDRMTGDSCAVCIKLVDGKSFISTTLRDPVSARERGDVDRQPALMNFDYRSNTAFRKILSDDDPATFFADDDLVGLYNRGDYINANPRWQKLYSATLVAPIRYLYDKNRNACVIGFICVDNKRGLLDNEMAKDLLAWFADILFHILFLVGTSDRFEDFVKFVETRTTSD